MAILYTAQFKKLERGELATMKPEDSANLAFKDANGVIKTCRCVGELSGAPMFRLFDGKKGHRVFVFNESNKFVIYIIHINQ